MFDESKQNSDTSNSPDYERVCNKIYKLGNVMLGIHKFVPIEFTNDFSSLLRTTVHCTIEKIEIVSQTIFSSHTKLKIHREEISKEEKKLSFDPTDKVNFDEF